jgi:serine/threonine-protein kinase
VTIPNSIITMTPTNATSALTKLGLKVNPTTGSAYSLDVPQGAVAQTNPKAGRPVAKGSRVQLLLSQGPQPFSLPTLVGQTEKNADALISTHWTAAKAIQQFDAKVSSGTVIDALDAKNASLKGVAQYPEKQPITLVVSAGALPDDLAGKSVSDATEELKVLGLGVSGTTDVYSQDVDKGAVVGLVTTNADGSALTIRVGDQVQLQTSKGPEQVPVPNVVGQTWAVAKAALQAAGFKLSYAPIADLQPSAFIVSKVNPAAGVSVDKGSTVKVNFQGF